MSRTQKPAAHGAASPPCCPRAGEHPAKRHRWGPPPRRHDPRGRTALQGERARGTAGVINALRQHTGTRRLGSGARCTPAGMLLGEIGPVGTPPREQGWLLLLPISPPPARCRAEDKNPPPHPLLQQSSAEGCRILQGAGVFSMQEAEPSRSPVLCHGVRGQQWPNAACKESGAGAVLNPQPPHVAPRVPAGPAGTVTAQGARGTAPALCKAPSGLLWPGTEPAAAEHPLVRSARSCKAGLGSGSQPPCLSFPLRSSSRSSEQRGTARIPHPHLTAAPNHRGGPPGSPPLRSIPSSQWHLLPAHPRDHQPPGTAPPGDASCPAPALPATRGPSSSLPTGLRSHRRSPLDAGASDRPWLRPPPPSQRAARAPPGPPPQDPFQTCPFQARLSPSTQLRLHGRG